MPLPIIKSAQQIMAGATTFWQRPHGIVLSVPANDLGPDDAIEALNMELNEKGKYQTRGGLKRVTSSTTTGGSAIMHMAYIPVGAKIYLLLVDASHRLYVEEITSYDGTAVSLTPGTSIATLAGATTIQPFNTYGVIFDGSYIKYTQGTTVLMAYDDGTGSTGYFYDNSCATLGETVDLYGASYTRCGNLVTTPSWDTGYTMPFTQLDVWLSKTLAPSGTISAKLYNADGTTLRDTSETTYNATELTTTAKKWSFYFTTPYSMALSTGYVVIIEFSGGDVSNFVKVHCETLTSGGLVWKYDPSTWSQDSTATVAMACKPGRPPKAAFGAVKDTRLFVSGGTGAQGLVYFSNTNTFLDWSTPDGGGFIGPGDEDANNFQVGALIAHFGDLYAIGKEKQPYISKLTGSTPATWEFPPLFQQISCNHLTAMSLSNDIWLTGASSTHNLLGVQEYGDIRAYSPGDPIADRISTYFTSVAFAGYNPKKGQYILKLAGVTNMQVCHTKNPYPEQISEGMVITRYPWTEWVFTSITPASFINFNNRFYVGGTDGHIYLLDDALVADNAGAFAPNIKSGIIETPFNSMNLVRVYAALNSTAAVTALKARIYKNGTTGTYFDTDLTVKTAPNQQNINATVDSFQVNLYNPAFTKRIFVNGLVVGHRTISGKVS